MKQTTQEFINHRSKEILNEIRVLRHELAVLRNLKTSLQPQKNRVSPESGPAKISALTFQDMIIEVLRILPDGADAQLILARIYQDFGKKIERSSISPQLSRLKSKGVLTLQDNIWNLTPEHRFPKKETPDNAGAFNSGFI